MPRHSAIDERGLSLVDLMVGLAIGMVATLVILNVAVLFGARGRMAGGNADASLNAAHAVGLLSRELRMAGSGLGPVDALDCTVHRAAADAADATMAWRPVQITQGVDGRPDTLTVLASSTQATPPARLITPYTVGSGAMMLDTTIGLQAGDRLVLQAAGMTDCPMLRVESVSIGAYSVKPASTDVLQGKVFGTGSALINVGTLRYRRYSVDAHHQLQVEVFDAAAGKWITSSLADGIVSLQLQYGFDARAGAQTSPQVTLWSDQIIDADSDGNAGNAADWRRLLAVRMAVVARSPQRRDGICDATAPQWLAGAGPEGKLQPATISLTHVDDWACWRYRVLQAEVVLRNQLWSDG